MNAGIHLELTYDEARAFWHVGCHARFVADFVYERSQAFIPPLTIEQRTAILNALSNTFYALNRLHLAKEEDAWNPWATSYEVGGSHPRTRFPNPNYWRAK